MPVVNMLATPLNGFTKNNAIEISDTDLFFYDQKINFMEKTIGFLDGAMSETDFILNFNKNYSKHKMAPLFTQQQSSQFEQLFHILTEVVLLDSSTDLSQINSHHIMMARQIINDFCTEMTNDIYAKLFDEHIIKNGKKNLSIYQEKYDLLQVAYVQSQLLMIKSSDADWEEYALSCEVFDNIKNFLKSACCRLTEEYKIRYNVTYCDILYAFQCCQYNFAHSLLYRQVAKPLDINNIDYYTIVENKKQRVPEQVAYAIANSENALRLCQTSLANDVINQEDKLLSAARFLKNFYDIYLIYIEKTSHSFCEDAFIDVKGQAKIAVDEYNLFIPDEVKMDLQLL
ncbi:hypothetical protein SJI19_01910 [Acerihabitans sp. TG2]|uniref:hypothetical protein n=1 Tax=Acerihabitans sp. TG2 TaxID=3096008 RepID=UPI002B2304C6|nr:hypothetical protein [Acerihabitans sp. TG2]MEA9389318.1 hypothetical protein [Acerihabitans sp. TG2]